MTILNILDWLQKSGRDTAFAALAVFVLVNTSLAWGFTPDVYPGFASKNSLDKIEDSLQGLRGSFARTEASTLRVRLFNMRRDWCAALKGGNQALALSIAEQYDAAWMEYLILTGTQYPLKMCGEF